MIREALDGAADGAVDDEFDSLDEDSLLPLTFLSHSWAVGTSTVPCEAPDRSARSGRGGRSRRCRLRWHQGPVALTGLVVASPVTLSAYGLWPLPACASTCSRSSRCG